MNPFSINPLVLFVAALISIAFGAGIGWTANGWRLETKISEIKEARSSDAASQTKEALDDLTSASKKINNAANQLTADNKNFGTKLDSIGKGLKDVQSKNKLPVDCRPDLDRLHSLEAAVSALNKAIAGQ